MKSFELYPFQQEAVEAVRKEFDDGRKHTLLVLPTGCGKTVTFSEWLRQQVLKGGRGLILAHREELLTQAAQKLKSVTGLDSALEKADSSACLSDAPVTVASVQSLCRPERLKRFPAGYYTDIVIDEAHHSLSNSYRDIIDHFDTSRILGVTATPDRGDHRALSEVYESLAYEYPMRKAIREGYLVPIRAKMLPVEVDLTGVRTSCGDYSANSLGDAIEPYLDEIAGRMAEECKVRKTVVFLPLIRMAKRFAELLNAHGISAAEVNGDSPDREEILADFEAGKYQALCNAMLLTEGWDCPSVDCVVVLRPTKVRSLYQQMIGRGTRLYPGKEDLLILDFLYLTAKHDLCTPASLFSGTAEVEEKMDQILQSGEEMDVSEVEREAERDVMAERAASLAGQLEKSSRKKAKTVDPMEFALSVAAEDIALYEPTFGWEYDEPTPKQLQYLARCGIAADAIITKGLACVLIDKLIRRQNAGLSTPKQIRFLQQYGYDDAPGWSFERASHQISQILG